MFRAEQAFEGKRLINHVIRIHDVMMADFCEALCYMEHNCASYNLMRRSEAELHKCELNNSTHEAHENDLKEDPNFVYRGTKVRTNNMLTLFKFQFHTLFNCNSEGSYL